MGLRGTAGQMLPKQNFWYTAEQTALTLEVATAQCQEAKSHPLRVPEERFWGCLHTEVQKTSASVTAGDVGWVWRVYC